MLAASRKQHAINGTITYLMEEATLDINQGGNRIVERCRALF
jgi:hypothetical protein